MNDNEDIVDVQPIKDGDEPKGTKLSVHVDRHPSMIGKDTEYSKNLTDHIVIDTELGLQNHATLDQEELIRRDIEEITDSKEYYHITTEQLSELFGMKELRLKCLRHNIKELAVGFGPVVGSLFGIVGLAKLWGWMFPIGGFMILALLLGMGGCILYSIFRLMQMFSSGKGLPPEWRHNITIVNCKLEIKAARQSNVPLPIGAKLKMKEANDLDIFSAFMVAMPEITHNVPKLPRLPKVDLDPAVLGVTLTKEAKVKDMYLVSYWDPIEGVNKARSTMKQLRKLKVSSKR